MSTLTILAVLVLTTRAEYKHTTWFNNMTFNKDSKNLTLIKDVSNTTASTVTSSYTYHNYEPVWSYDDEEKWPGNLCKEGGKRQSPIDIRDSQVIKDYKKDFIKYGPIQFTGYEKVLVSGINNGHTVQFSTEGDNSMHPVLTGGPLKHVYQLEQIHFHWLSEHSINGVKFPMEIHFVHVRSDLQVADALMKKNGLAIVSLFCNVQADLEDYQLEAIEEIMQHMPGLMGTGDRVSGIIMDMTKLLNPSITRSINYYTYSGSLTSPNCDEAVTWIIFTEPIYMSDVNYKLFGKIGVGRHNFRSLQRLNRHQIFKPPGPVEAPRIVTYFESMILFVTGFFRNITNMFSRGFQ